MPRIGKGQLGQWSLLVSFIQVLMCGTYIRAIRRMEGGQRPLHRVNPEKNGSS